MHAILIPFGSAGDVHPFLGLGLALRERGHRVTFLLHEHFEPLTRQLGFESVAIGQDVRYEDVVKDPNLWHPTRSFPIVIRMALEGARRTYPLIAERYVAGETVVVAGTLGFGARLAQETLGIPTATVHLQPGILRSVHETPSLPGITMGSWWPKPLKRLFYRALDALIVDRVVAPGLNAYRAELGLPGIRRPLDTWWHSPDLVLGLFPAWYARPQPDWPAQLKLTGFPLYDERDASPLTKEVASFLDAGPPPIVFTPGSAMIHGRPFFEAAADACRRLGARGLLLTRFAEQVPDGLPEGVRHVAYAPFGALLPRASALVHHGGIGTSAQGMASGVPQLVMPLAHDQFDNAARLGRLGVALAIPPNRFRGPTVALALRSLLDSRDVADSCREVARRFQGVRPLDDACEALEALARSRTVRDRALTS